MFGIEQKVAKTARKAGLVTASAALMLVGAGFLTAAVWIYLATTQTALFAAVVIGMAYLGLGAVTLGFAAKTPEPPHEPDPLQGLTPMQTVLVAFLQGMDQGKRAKRH
jgi:hypothetical protein